MIAFTFTGNASGAMDLLDRFEQAAEDVAGPIGEALLDAGDIYLEAMQTRYESAARGDGTWEPLSDAAARKKNDGVILGFGDLYHSLFAGDPNNVLRVFAEGTTLSVIAGTAHPAAPFHQYGAGHLPRREIIVPPDGSTQQRMAAAVSAGLQSIVAGLRAGV